MRSQLAVAVVAAALVVSARAEAGTFTFAKAKVTIDVPAGWATDDEGDTVTFSSADGSLALNLAYAPVDVDTGWSILVDQVNQTVSGVKVSKKAGVMQDLSGYVDSSAGSLQGTKVQCMLAAFSANGGTMTVFVIGQKGVYEKHGDVLTAMLASLSAGTGGAAAGGLDWEGGTVPDAGKAFAAKLVAAIDKNDSKAFLKMVGKKGVAFYADGDGSYNLTVKPSKMKKAIKKAGSVAQFLDLPDHGDWRVGYPDDGSTGYYLYRDARDSFVVYVVVELQKKKWVVTGSYTRETGEEPSDE